MTNSLCLQGFSVLTFAAVTDVVRSRVMTRLALCVEETDMESAVPSRLYSTIIRTLRALE